PGPSIGSALSRSSTSRVTFELHGMRPRTRSGADRRRSRTAVVSVESGTGMSGRVDRSVTETTDRPGGGFELLDLFGKTAYLHRIEAHSEPTWSRDCRIVFEFDLFEQHDDLAIRTIDADRDGTDRPRQIRWWKRLGRPDLGGRTLIG